MRKISVLLFLSILTLNATEQEPLIKRKLKSNMLVTYIEHPKSANNFNDFLENGIFYGRLRFNNFIFDAQEVGEDYYVSGLGGSLIYKSAFLNGFSFTSGLYTSQAIEREGEAFAKNYKSGRDVLNRHNLATQNQKGVTALAQMYGEYKDNQNQIKLGDFFIESLLLKSNDTKMIPNSFEGVYYQSKALPKTTIQTAYITKQKLRDKTDFHHLLAYGDNQDDPYSQWTENDDSGMHRGLTLSKLKEKNIDDRVILVEVTNKTIENSKLTASYTAVPKLISSLILEGEYKVQLNNLSVTPSIRYMEQFDNGAGEIAGANLRNKTVGYSDPTSLSSSLVAGRIDFKSDIARIRLGYSKVADKGDILAPWRGFPTAGYTRAMGQTNWYANTETFMVRGDYDFSNVGIKNLKGMSRYSITNFDDNKVGVQADTKVLTIDFIKGFDSLPNLSAKLRTAFIKSDADTIAQDGSLKKDTSYNEVRIELNYLF